MAAKQTSTSSTRTEASDKMCGTLCDLHQLNVDSAKGFRECAELTKNDPLSSLCSRLAGQRDQQAARLAEFIPAGDRPKMDDGSFSAQFHRGWIKVRSALSTDDVGVVLSEAERGEDVIKEAYEEAMKVCVGSPAHAVISEQYAAVKAGHDQIRNLRDMHKDAD